MLAGMLPLALVELPVLDAVPVLFLEPEAPVAVGMSEMATPAFLQRSLTAGAISVVDASANFRGRVMGKGRWNGGRGGEWAMGGEKGRGNGGRERTGNVLGLALLRHALEDRVGDLVLAGRALALGVVEVAAGGGDGGGEAAQL